MKEVPEDYRIAIDALVKWAESVHLRLHVLEAVIQERLGITKKEWKDLLIRADQLGGPPPSLRSITATIEGVAGHFQELRTL